MPVFAATAPLFLWYKTICFLQIPVTCAGASRRFPLERFRGFLDIQQKEQ
jgi:hypothetical protein